MRAMLAAPLLFLMGIIFIVISVDRTFEIFRYAKFPTTEGRIVLSETYKFTGRQGKAFRKVEKDGVRVRFRYSVDGKTYESEELGYVRNTNIESEETPEHALARYPVGTELTVHYNPENPTQAVTQVDSPFGMFLLFGLGGVFFWLGAMLIWGDPKLKKF